MGFSSLSLTIHDHAVLNSKLTKSLFQSCKKSCKSCGKHRDKSCGKVMCNFCQFKQLFESAAWWHVIGGLPTWTLKIEFRTTKMKVNAGFVICSFVCLSQRNHDASHFSSPDQIDSVLLSIKILSIVKMSTFGSSLTQPNGFARQMFLMLLGCQFRLKADMTNL